MEGVGARLGRSSTRYGPTTVFTGPVRRWKKKWVHVAPASSNNNHHHHHHHHTAANGTVNGSNGSHLLLFKWTPITASLNKENGNGATNGNGDDAKDDDKDDGVLIEEPPKRKFKYIPVALLEEQKSEVAELAEDEPKAIETDTNTAELTSKSDGFDEKPDINDVPMEESQDTENNRVERQDLNESTLDLSLGLTAGDNDSDSKVDQSKEA